MKKNSIIEISPLERLYENVQKPIDTTSSQTIAKPNVICSFLRVLGFYEVSPTMYKLPLPTTGTYLLSDENGSLWMEYDEGHGDNFKQSVGFGKFEKTQIAVLVSVMSCPEIG